MLRRAVVLGSVALASACSLLVDSGGLSGDAPETRDGGDATATDGPSGLPSDGSIEAASDAGPDVVAVHPYVAAVLADGPIAYYRFEETTGFAAKTEVGTIDGVYSGAVTLAAPGAFTGSLGIALDGGLGGVSLGQAFDFVGRMPFSVEAWYEPTTYAPDFRFLISREGLDDAGRETYGIWFNPTTGSRMQFERYVAGVKTGPGGDAPSTGTFHHIVGTYDGTTLALFVDAVLVDVSTDTRDARSTAVDCWIGRQSGEYAALSGVIDEVAIYDKALPPTRISAHFTSAGK